PALVRAPAVGSVNRLKIKSEVALPAETLIAANPSRKELEALNRDGLVLASLSREAARSGEMEALSATLRAYLGRKNPEDASALANYIRNNQDSPWTPGLKVTKGVHDYHAGKFSEALISFEEAWVALKSSQDPKVREASV